MDHVQRKGRRSVIEIERDFSIAILNPSLIVRAILLHSLREQRRRIGDYPETQNGQKPKEVLHDFDLRAAWTGATSMPSLGLAKFFPKLSVHSVSAINYLLRESIRRRFGTVLCSGDSAPNGSRSSRGACSARS